ncbi:MAG: hypothetical protein CSA50_01850 [Gammaproteobacteria bacterium]|nr:MAG: hypothetical protein CSA50_01850 [Gammaproteobacteria bacterium]
MAKKSDYLRRDALPPSNAPAGPDRKIVTIVFSIYQPKASFITILPTTPEKTTTNPLTKIQALLPSQFLKNSLKSSDISPAAQNEAMIAYKMSI